MKKYSRDLQFTPAFLETRRAIESATDDIDHWKAIRNQAERLLLRTKDIRVLCWWMRAGIRTGAMHLFSFGLNLLNEWIRNDWDNLYPVLGNNGDATPRFAALSTLVFRKGIPGDLRDSLLFANINRPDQSVSLRQIESTLTQSEVSGSLPFTQETIIPWLRNAHRIAPLSFNDTIETAKETGALLLTCKNSLHHLSSSLVQHTNNSIEGIDLEPLLGLCEILDIGFSNGKYPDSVKSTKELSNSGPVNSDKANSAGDQAASMNRQTIWDLIERACVSLEATEPCNPASLILRRGQKILRLPFLEQMAELHPESLSQLKKVLGAA